MADFCPHCYAPVGKLFMLCDWCGLRYCKDCVDPRKHKCMSYDPNQPKPTPKTYINEYSKERYEGFAPPDQLEPQDESRLHLSDAEMKNHRIEGNLIHKERKRLDVAHLGDTCPICYSNVNKADEKCELCTIKFCGYCIKPIKHRCVIYQHRNGAFPEPNVRERVVVIPEPVTAPYSEPIIEPEAEPELVQAQQPEFLPEPEKTENKMSLWQKILSMFGLGKKRVG